MRGAHNKELIVATVSVLLSFTAFGQKSITLSECLELAKNNAPGLKAAEGAIRSSELAKNEIATTRLPQLKGVVGGSYAPVPPNFGYDPVISNGGQLAGQVVLEQSVYDAGVRNLKSDQIDYDTKRLSKERQRTNRDLEFEVQQTFIEALRAQNEVQLQTQSAEQLADYLGVVQRLYKSGNASYTDVLKTDIQLSAAKMSLENANESLTTAKYALSELTATDVDSSVSLGGSLDSLIALPDTLFDGKKFELARTLDVSIAELGLQRTLFDVELAKRERMPIISFVADAGYLNSIDALRLSNKDRFTGPGFSIGLGLELPILNWGATDLRIQQREIETDAVRFQLEILRRSLQREFLTVQLQLDKAKEKLQTLHSNLSKAEENFVLTKSKYTGGAALSLEVLTAQQLLTDTKLSELQTLADIQSLLAKLKQLHEQ
jgi:outer membrane protein TolC